MADTMSLSRKLYTLPGQYYSKESILRFKSSEKFPEHFCALPNWKSRNEYMQRTVTRTFSLKKAKDFLDSSSEQILIEQEMVPIPWATLHGIFAESGENRDKIILHNNSHLKEVFEKIGVCLYTNMHTKSACSAFSCPKFEFNNEGKEEGPDKLPKKEDEEIDYEKIDFDELCGEESNEYEEGEIDYGDENG